MSDLFEALRLFIINAGSIARLEVGGELDLATVDALREHLDLLVESGTGDVEVDMARVTFCDATALPRWLPPAIASTPSTAGCGSSTHPPGSCGSCRSPPSTDAVDPS